MKKIKLLGLLLSMFLGILLGCSESSAATINDLKSKFPHGAYWNHVVKYGHGYSNYQDYGACNNPDGYTWTPCNTHNGNVGVGGYDCNSFQNAMQCCGFAKKLAYDLYGSTHSSWGRTTLANVKVGDVIHYKGAGADATYGHWAMIIGKSGNVLTFGECNVGSNCKISWGRTLDAGRMSSYTIYSAPWAASIAPSDTQKPAISDATITDITKDGYTVTCAISDNVGVVSMKFPSWNSDIHTGNDATWLTGTITGHMASVRVNLADLKSGSIQGNYMTHIYAYDAAGNSTCLVIDAAVYIDKTPPTISDVKVLFSDYYGYTLECSVNDSGGISQVRFPTWTSENGQDDMASDWPYGYTYDGKWRYRVNVSEHNNEYGNYNTHIYAYDAYGNSSCVAVNPVFLCKQYMPIDIVVSGNKLYTAFNEALGWEAAKTEAEKMGGTLACVTDENENKIFSDMCAKGGQPGYFLGGYRASETSFVWYSGEYMFWSNWNLGEPNDANGEEDVMVMLSNPNVLGKWNDITKDYKMAGFFVEIPLDLKPVSAITVGNKCYELYYQQMPWHVAKRFCEAKKGNLVAINSEEEATLISELVKDYQGEIDKFYIGASDELVEGQFAWVTGETFDNSVINWDIYEPTDGPTVGGQDYIRINTDGLYDDVCASGQYGFILEKDVKQASNNDNNDDENTDEKEIGLPDNDLFVSFEEDDTISIPRKTSLIKKVVKTGKKVKVVLKKKNKAKKYQVQYATNKKMKKKKIVSSKTNKIILKKLKKKKVYYIRARICTKTKKGKWSKIKKVTMK